MNLNKMFVFLFVFLGLLALLLATMPMQFLSLGVAASYQDDKEAREFFDENDVTTYNITLSENLTWADSVKEQFGFPSGQMLEFWWSEYVLADIGGPVIQVLGLRHLTNNIWGWWYGWHWLEVGEPYASQVEYPYIGLQKQDLLDLFDEDANASYCEFACDHVTVKLFIVTYNENWTLSESWDNGQLKIFTSYNIDWTQTSTTMWHIMFELLAFQNPNLGLPGLAGTILNGAFALALWASIALLGFALVTSVIPFIRGWVGGGD